MSSKQIKRGFTLVEVMVAMALGLLLLAAIVTVMANSGRTNRNQQALARMQENGRFALAKIVSDVRMIGAQYCTGYANEEAIGRYSRQRSLTVYADNSGSGGLAFGLPARTTLGGGLDPDVPYALSPRFFIQGHECSAGAACSPNFSVIASGFPDPGAAGMADGSRARGADVLTLRYLSGPGVPVESMTAAGIALNPVFTSDVSAEPLNFEPGNLAMVADCSTANVFEASANGLVVTPNDNNDAGAARNDVGSFAKENDARVFNFSKDFMTVSYFLRLRLDRDDTAGTRRVSTLVRQVNGSIQPIIDGVERLEFRYGVESLDGNVRYLTADQVQNAPITDCLPTPSGYSAQETGCLWRSVRSIDVALLLNSVQNDAPSATERYSFTFDNQRDVVPAATLPSGLPRERLFRREFRTTVFLRNFGL